MSNTRIERDSMGQLHVPEAALYGAQTQRAVINFPISHQRMPGQFIRALILAKAAAAEQLLAPMSEQGVLLLSKPFSNTLFLQAIHLAAASNHRLQLLRQENARMQEKIAQVRLVSHAKCCLVEREQMSEDAAHRYIEKRAMDTRRSRAEIAQEILDSYED